MRRHIWVEDDQAPQALLKVLERLTEESGSWASWCSAMDVMAELMKLGLSDGFSVAVGSLPEHGRLPTEASWLAWGQWCILTTAEWMFVYPSQEWRRLSGANVSLTLDEREAVALLKAMREGGLN